MKLYTLFQANEKVVYSSAVNGKSFFFYKGFSCAKEAKETILSQFKGIERICYENSLVGEWSEIE